VPVLRAVSPGNTRVPQVTIENPIKPNTEIVIVKRN
jgi:hypothetical protein